MHSKHHKRHRLDRYELIIKLFEKANKYHQKTCTAMGRWMDYVKKCGDALVEARLYFPLRSKYWRKYVEDHFDASYETAKVYMRIARKWNDPRIQAAKKNGMSINSIAGFLQVLKYQQLPDDKSESESDKLTKETEMDMMRDMLRKDFAEKLRQLDYDELLILEEDFDYYWQKLYAGLYNDACAKLGFDLNEYLWECGKLDGKIPDFKVRLKYRWRARRLGESAARFDMLMTNPEKRKEGVELRKLEQKQARRKVQRRLNRKY